MVLRIHLAAKIYRQSESRHGFLQFLETQIMNKQSGTIHHSIFEYHRKRKKRFINHIAIYPHTQNILCLTITFGTMLGAYVVFPTLVETIVNVPINKRSATAQLIYLSHFGSNAKNDNFPFFFCSDM